jgi:hypothetical protein
LSLCCLNKREGNSKENPAADGQGHGGVPGPFERGSTVGAASATLAGDPVFRNVAVLKNQRAILFNPHSPDNVLSFGAACAIRT